MDSIQPICVYCGRREKETDDHVPPKSFYPKPRPSDLITVPACLQCNQDAGKDEEFFLATFMFSEAGITKAGNLLWSEKLRRMYEKNLGLKRKIADNLERSDIMTPAGIFLGRKMTIKTDEARFERVANKIVKGLYYFEYKETMPANTKLMTLFLRNQEHFDAAKKVVDELRPGSRKWPGIFEYKYNRMVKSISESIWLLLFWDYATFWSFSYQEDKLQSILVKANESLESDT